MRHLNTIVATAIASAILIPSVPSQAESNAWLSFRGDGSSSASSGPEVLDTTDQGNLVWSTTMPGRSVAAPIVIGGLVVSTSAEGPDEPNLFVTGLDVETGKVRWQQSFRATGRPFHHPTSSGAAPTPASDGNRIVAFYSSNDLVCLDLDGNLVWYRGLGSDYPKAGNDVGMASSPVIVDGAVIVQVECQGDSFAAAIELETGKNRWRISRPAASNWASPAAITRPNGSQEVILQSGSDLVAVDPANGTELWRMDEPRASIPSATKGNGMLLVPGSDLMALRIGEGTGKPEVVWQESKLSPKNACVAIAGDRAYVLKGSVLIAASVESGETIWQQRLSGLGGTWASPVVAGDRIYIFDQSGVGLVVQDKGDEAEVVSTVELGDGVLGSPAIADGKLFIRSQTKMFCFE
ncbi:PQQ-like beta-propeller repeat protein [Rubripirellula amarantea]|nr:PQQ-like beta-propeller repeat protein [Rubripirellula amarantea]